MKRFIFEVKYNKLSEEKLLQLVPSVFSDKASDKTSSRYSLIPTIEVLRGLSKAGFYPVKASETRCREKDNAPYTKHMLRLRHESLSHERVAGNCTEIVLINSHNGLSSYQLRGGIYRLVCSNGLIIGDDYFSQNVRHQGDVISKVVEGCNLIVDRLPKAQETVEKWKGITLEGEARRIYAESAMLLKHDKESMPFAPDKLLSPQRHEDLKKDLWTTFNVVQERVIRGGTRYVNREANMRQTTREVKSIGENVRLNMALWNLTEKMAQLVK